jgi:DNA-binding transcriptional regulator LsrR (DeoR family)
MGSQQRPAGGNSSIAMELDQSRNDDDDLLVKVAWLYYVANRNQEQIAAQLGMSRFKITRLLTRAREQGIVKIVIDQQSTETLVIGEQIALAYGLTECIVTPPLDIEAPDTDEVGRSAVGMAAASFLVRRLQGFDHVTIGLGWGRTIAAMVQAFPTMTKPNARFVSLMGSLSRTARSNPFDVVHALAQACGGEAYLLPAPFIADTETDFDVLMSQTIVREALAIGSAADFSIASFGSCSRDSLAAQYGLLHESEIEELIATGAVGDMLGKFFDARGELVSSSLNRRAPSIPLDSIRARELVLLGAGLAKRDALRAVLRSGVVNRLIVDGSLALAVLDG